MSEMEYNVELDFLIYANDADEESFLKCGPYVKTSVDHLAYCNAGGIIQGEDYNTDFPLYTYRLEDYKGAEMMKDLLESNSFVAATVQNLGEAPYTILFFHHNTDKLFSYPDKTIIKGFDLRIDAYRKRNYWIESEIKVYMRKEFMKFIKTYFSINNERRYDLE